MEEVLDISKQTGLLVHDVQDPHHSRLFRLEEGAFLRTNLDPRSRTSALILEDFFTCRVT